MALPPNWREFPDEDLVRLREFQEQMEYKRGLRIRPWRETARPKQLPPDDPKHHMPWVHPDTSIVYRCDDPRCQAGEIDQNWATWLCMSGRGTGKTWQASSWLLEQALANDGTTWMVAAPTYGDLRQICLEGDTGLLAMAVAGDIQDYNRNNHELRMRNGSKIIGCSGERPDSPRGLNLSGAWIDEICSFEGDEFYTYGLMPALRKNDAKLVITTTPSRTKLIRKLVKDAENPELRIHVTRSPTAENPHFAKHRLLALQSQHAGTRFYRQELEGELMEDVAGALIEFEWIERARITEAPEDLTRIVVALDPAMSSGKRSDESGIVVAAQDADGHGYILADRSIHGTTEQVVREAVSAYHGYMADCIVVEGNQGKMFVEGAIKAADPEVVVRMVHAMSGKFIRAERVAVFYESGRIHHVGVFDKLEDQLCAITPDGDRKAMGDDRADAAVYAILELKGLSEGSYLAAYGFAECEKCGTLMSKYMGLCPSCGHFRTPGTVNEVKDPEANRWADVYLRTCENCGKQYPKHMPRCPDCNMAPEKFLAAVGRFTGNSPGWTHRDYRGIWKRSGF